MEDIRCEAGGVGVNVKFGSLFALFASAPVINTTA